MRATPRKIQPVEHARRRDHQPHFPVWQSPWRYDIHPYAASHCANRKAEIGMLGEKFRPYRQNQREDHNPDQPVEFFNDLGVILASLAKTFSAVGLPHAPRFISPKEPFASYFPYPAGRGYKITNVIHHTQNPSCHTTASFVPRRIILTQQAINDSLQR